VILVDSDILIAHLRGIPAAHEWLVRSRREVGELATSVIVVTEVAGGMRSLERREVVALLSSLRVFPISERVAWRAAELMRAYRRANPGISLDDYMVAATAQLEGCNLATLNVRHFPMFPHIRAPFAV
jgi:predicted nucleic acid-binding protein